MLETSNIRFYFTIARKGNCILAVYYDCFQLSCEVLKYHARMEEKRQQKAIEMAGLIACMVRDFWADMTEVRCYLFNLLNNRFVISLLILYN